MKPSDNPDYFRSRLALDRDRDGTLYQPAIRADLERYLRSAGPGRRQPSGHLAAIEAVASVRMAAKAMHVAMERWAEGRGLSEGRLQLLFALRLSPDGIPLGRLARIQNVSPRNITGLVDILERDGLVERVPDRSDRRSVVARLTETGRERIACLWQDAMTQQDPLTRDFSLEELIQLRHLALRMFRNLACETGPLPE